MYTRGLIRGPFFSKSFIPTAARSQKTSPKNRCSCGGLRISRPFFGAPYQLFKRFPPQNGRLGPNFWKTFRKPHGLLISLSRSAERTTFQPGPQKEGLLKVCRKFDTICTPHSAERTIFSRYDSKKRSVPQKASFSARFSELSRKSRQSTTWAIRANPGKTSAKRPQLTFPPPLHTRVAHLDLSMYPPFFCCCCFQPFYVWGGGGGLCLFISRHRLFALICLLCCF